MRKIGWLQIKVYLIFEITTLLFDLIVKFDKYFSGCHYFGQLEKDMDACVAVTGCVGSEDVEITIKSSLYDTSPHGYVWGKDGSTREGESHENLRHEYIVTEESRLYSIPEGGVISSRSIEDDTCLLLEPPPTQHLKVRVV